MRQALLISTGIPLPFPPDLTGLPFIEKMAKGLTKEVKSLATDEINLAFDEVEGALEPSREGRFASEVQLKSLTDTSYQALYEVLLNLEGVTRPGPNWRPSPEGMEFVGPSRADGISYAWVSYECKEEFLERGKACLRL